MWKVAQVNQITNFFQSDSIDSVLFFFVLIVFDEHLEFVI